MTITYIHHDQNFYPRIPGNDLAYSLDEMARVLLMFYPSVPVVQPINQSVEQVGQVMPPAVIHGLRIRCGPL